MILAIVMAESTLFGVQSSGRIRNVQPERPVVQQNVQEPLHTHIRLTGERPIYPDHSAEQILIAFADQHTAGNYTGSELLARDLIEMIPSHPEGYYNLACALARQQKTQEALVALQNAVEFGWRDLQHTRVDPDLQRLHSEPKFGELLTQMESLRATESITNRHLRVEPATDIAAELGEVVPELLNRYHVPGIVVAYVVEAETAWIQTYGHSSTVSDAAIGSDDQLSMRRPVELLALLAAGNEIHANRLDVGRLLREADDIGLRTPMVRSDTGSGKSVLSSVSPQLAGRTRLPALAIPSHQQKRFDWDGVQTIPGTLDLIMLGVELTSEQSFLEYCSQSVLEPAGIENAALHRASMRDSGLQNESFVQQKIVGHSRFGTPILPASTRENVPMLEMSIVDLCRLLCATMRTDEGDVHARRLHSVMQDANSARLGLGLSIERCSSGDRTVSSGFQFAELDQGRGVLARWYPDAGRGIVVFFNSENGPDVAARIVNHALGGG